MCETFITALIGLVTGVIGYWVNMFWMQPILQYRQLRGKILIALIFYAQVINPDGLNKAMETLFEERLVANRRLSTELTACLLELPFWFRWYLRSRNHMPESAAKALLGLSSTTDYEHAHQRIEKIGGALRINVSSL